MVFGKVITVLVFLALYENMVNGQCGQSKIQPRLPTSAPARTRIINGSPAVPNSWPWTVWVFYDVGGGRGFMCGGSLINPDTVLTAAHCVMNQDGSQRYAPSGFTVILGGQNIRNPDEESQIWSKVKSVKAHESYNPRRIVNDVALLKLEAPVEYSQYIQPICLPAAGQNPANPNKCYAVGWGRISNDNSTTADVLQQALLPILSDDACASSWGNTYQKDIMLCAGYLNGSKSTCQGDSGGPLVCEDGNHFTLFGSTSFGNGAVGPNGLPKCAAANRPAVFARTSSFLSWIQQTARSM